jgi:hypothetical protein
MKRLMAAALLTATPALAQGTACLRPTQVLEFQPLPAEQLLVIDNWKKHYRVSFVGPCPHISSYSQFTIKSAATGPLACALAGDTILVRDPGGPPNRCIVKTITAE